ncbi:MAG: hypothetical protein GEU98_19530 [Pseudonocardiaceae bacterium]|nr:hypothetical protein [Pseudonocardiaceae bacterium]
MITRVLDVGFRICLALFVLGGLAMVLGQAAGLLTGSGELVEGVVDWLGPPTFVLASVAGLAGFGLAYLKGWDTTD